MVYQRLKDYGLDTKNYNFLINKDSSSYLCYNMQDLKKMMEIDDINALPSKLRHIYLAPHKALNIDPYNTDMNLLRYFQID